MNLEAIVRNLICQFTHDSQQAAVDPKQNIIFNNRKSISQSSMNVTQTSDYGLCNNGCGGSKNSTRQCTQS
jgi:hypothetical protein